MTISQRCFVNSIDLLFLICSTFLWKFSKITFFKNFLNNQPQAVYFFFFLSIILNRSDRNWPYTLTLKKFLNWKRLKARSEIKRWLQRRWLELCSLFSLSWNMLNKKITGKLAKWTFHSKRIVSENLVGKWILVIYHLWNHLSFSMGVLQALHSKCNRCYPVTLIFTLHFIWISL